MFSVHLGVPVQGLVYTNTDVEEVHDWIVKHFSDHPLFCRVSDEELVRLSFNNLRPKTLFIRPEFLNTAIVLKHKIMAVIVSVCVGLVNVMFGLIVSQADDIIISHLGTCTEEGKKVQRNGGKNFLAVFRRVEDPQT